MSTDRTFCRFTRAPDPLSVHEIPADGMCLSAFLILSPPGHPERVLVGRMDPSAPWDHLGGLGPERVEAHRRNWMLPSSQLLLGEGPDEAARRILAEQVGGIAVALDPVRVASEVYALRRAPERRRHWDLHFLYRGRTASPDVPRAPAWSELAFVDVPSSPASAFARAHDEVLALVGLVPAARPPSA